MERLSFLSNHSLAKNITLIGNHIVGVSFKTLFVIVFILIWVWVVLNDGHMTVNNQFESTVNLKVKEGFSTNYTADDFNSIYVRPYEYDNYNGQWDSSDYTFEAPNEIGVMTNMVITANQTQKLCPEHPNLYLAVCNPHNNTCVRGTASVHGFRTGKCVAADFPFRKNDDEPWRNVSTCQIRGWCPVERYLPPLTGFRAVLSSTMNSTMRIQSTIYFNDYKIIRNSLNYSQLNQDYILTCRYHPDTDPLCPTFLLKDIIKLTPNAEESYEQMAKAGAVISIQINWDCRINGYLKKDYNSLFDCKPQYSFVRTDKYNFVDQTTYRFVRYYNNGKMRTHYRTWRIRFVVNTKVLVKEFHFFRFLTALFAYSSTFTIVTWIFNKILTLYCNKYRNIKLDEEINLTIEGKENSDNNDIDNDNTENECDTEPEGDDDQDENLIK
jgi:hypothetical protein